MTHPGGFSRCSEERRGSIRSPAAAVQTGPAFAEITSQRLSEGAHYIDLPNKHDLQVLSSIAIACPNTSCLELFLTASLAPFQTQNGPGGYRRKIGKAHSTWSLRPQAEVRVFPDYVPVPILADYREACLIRDLSPKASATLSRRCLQGMIRDFWKIQKSRLIDEIEALEGKIDTKTWDAVDAVRKLGNIGAHMEKDINLVLEVEPDEARLLLELIETLISDWYVERYERAKRMERIISAAAAKGEAKRELAAARDVAARGEKVS